MAKPGVQSVRMAILAMAAVLAACSSNGAESSTIDARTGSNRPSIRTSVHRAGVVYGLYVHVRTGGTSDIVLVRAYFKWRLFTPFLSGGLENMGAGSGMRLMSTATAFRNEPYSDVGPVGAKC